MEGESTISDDVLLKLEHLAEKLETMQLSPEYMLANQALIQAQKDNFEMLDRSLTIMQAMHNAESKNGDFYTEVIKFLLPLFTTAAIAGATITVQNVNSVVLMGIGLAGIVASLIFLVPLLVSRHRRAVRQRGEYEKLAKAFEVWKSIADMQRKANSDITNFDDAKVLSEEFSDLIKAVETSNSTIKK